MNADEDSSNPLKGSADAKDPFYIIEINDSKTEVPIKFTYAADDYLKRVYFGVNNKTEKAYEFVYDPEDNTLVIKHTFNNIYSHEKVLFNCPSNDHECEKFLGKLAYISSFCDDDCLGLKEYKETLKGKDLDDFLDEANSSYNKSIRKKDIEEQERKQILLSDAEDAHILANKPILEKILFFVPTLEEELIKNLMLFNVIAFVLSVGVAVLFYVGIGIDQNTMFQLLLKDCNMPTYNSVANAQWPVASSEYYLKNFQMSNITANSEWYADQNLCGGWQFIPEEGFCPMEAASVTVYYGTTKEFEGTYSEFAAKDPHGEAASNICAEKFEVNKRLRRHLATSSSTKKKTTNKDSWNTSIKYTNCIKPTYAGSGDVFTNIDKANKESTPSIESHFKDGWDQFTYASNLNYTLAISGWIFLGLGFMYTMVSAFAIDDYRPSEETLLGVLVGDIVLFVLTLYMTFGAITLISLIGGNPLLNEPSKAWAPMFPTCSVDFHTFNGFYQRVPIGALCLGILIIPIRIIHLKAVIHMYGKESQPFDRDAYLASI